MSPKIPDRPLPNSYWVLPGEFLAGEHPRCGVTTTSDLRDRLRKLMDFGIDYFIDLTMPDELQPYEAELPAGVSYLRRPIGDHNIPARREHMSEILGHLESALAAGRRPYVHCHAGIGRTGTVAGCFLIERGESGDSALDALNGLWQQCERSRLWAYVPETDEQIKFVRTWTPVTARDPVAKLATIALATPATSQTPSRPRARDQGLRDRFQGALLGLAVGDALAVATEGRKAGSFDAVHGLAGGGSFELPAGAWTDDTAMALCVADSLLACDRFDVRDQVERFNRWHQDGYLAATGKCVGITPNTARAITAAQWRRQMFPGSHDPTQLDPEVLSRVAPAVLFTYGSPQDAHRYAADAARITCQAPVAVETCQLFAELVYRALTNAGKEELLNPGALDLPHLRQQMGELLSLPHLDAQKPPSGHGATPDMLAAALWAFKTTQNFSDGMLRAVNLGGRSDVAAAVYGQLAGAFYGGQAIPPAWRNRLMRKGLIADFADRLFAHVAKAPIG